MRTLVLLSLVAFALPAAAGEAGNTKQLVATDAAQAGPDFAVQGEYEGTAGTAKFAAQVIAQGDGAFHAVLYAGGLPGAGWDTKTSSDADGKAEGGKAIFTGAWSGSIADKVFTGKTDHGDAFTLKRVERQSPTMGEKPPKGAVVLFDGSNVDAWDKGVIETIGGEKLLACGPETKRKFTSYQLHLEFRTPFKPKGQGQDRCNSGVYIHHTYEIQILDSFGLKPEKNYAGALYTVVAPSINMCLPPLSWQTYDIDFQGPKFDAAGKKTGNAVVTVRLNNVAVQDKLEIEHGTGANKAKAETPAGGPLWLQDHGNPVFFRNVWLLEKP